MTWGTGIPEQQPQRGWWDQNPQNPQQQPYPQQPPPGWGLPGPYGVPPPPPPPSNNNKTPIVISAAVVIVAALAIGGYIAFGRSSDTTHATPAAQTSSAAAAPSTADPTAIAGAAAAGGGVATTNPAALYGIWNGTYTCGQGATALTLTLASATTESGLHAVFSFASTPANPVPPGSYLMSGTLTDDVLQLNPERWINQPAGYQMVPLSAEVSGAQPTAITGRVQSAGCTSFTVTRQ